jgi:methylmalonyl-CoA/ethylmalonyl-CoA epimerase
MSPHEKPGARVTQQPDSRSFAPQRTPAEPLARGVIRRLDHVAIAVWDTEIALRHFRDRLGLRVVHREELDRPRIRLTYLDAGNALLQLVEPLDDDSDIARSLEENGEGLHHICFGVDDALGAADSLAANDGEAVIGTGRGRISAFVPGAPVHGVRVECTEFQAREDVEQTPGWLAD